MSKTRLTKLVRAFDAKAVARLLDVSPDLLGMRDARGRGWLHLCCAVDAKAKGLRPSAQVATARVLVAAGLGLDDAAFTEGDGWQATPLWFAVARGRNLKLAAWLLDEGASPEYCMHAAAYRSDLEAMRLLLDHGASVDPATHPDTPLLDSLRGRRFEVARDPQARFAARLTRAAKPGFMRDQRPRAAGAFESKSREQEPRSERAVDE